MLNSVIIMQLSRHCYTVHCDIKLYLSVLQNLQPAVDKFLWRTAVGEFSFHCPFPLQPVTHNKIYLVKRKEAGAAATALDWTCELPARTSEFACCFWCNADRWCSSASHSDRFPASRTTSAGEQTITITRLFTSVSSVMPLTFVSLYRWGFLLDCYKCQVLAKKKKTQHHPPPTLSHQNNATTPEAQPHWNHPGRLLFVPPPHVWTANQ